MKWFDIDLSFKKPRLPLRLGLSFGPGRPEQCGLEHDRRRGELRRLRIRGNVLIFAYCTRITRICRATAMSLAFSELVGVATTSATSSRRHSISSNPCTDASRTATSTRGLGAGLPPAAADLSLGAALDTDNSNHSLLLPIFVRYVDNLGVPCSDRSGRERKAFLRKSVRAHSGPSSRPCGRTGSDPLSLGPVTTLATWNLTPVTIGNGSTRLPFGCHVEKRRVLF